MQQERQQQENIHLAGLYRDICTIAVLLMSCQHCPDQARAQAAGEHASVCLIAFIDLVGPALKDLHSH